MTHSRLGFRALRYGNQRSNLSTRYHHSHTVISTSSLRIERREREKERENMKGAREEIFSGARGERRGAEWRS